MSRASTRRLGAEAGFSLVELLVTMVVMLVVLGSVIVVFEQFQQTGGTQSDRADVQSALRESVDTMAQEIRTAGPTATSGAQAAVITRAGGLDLVVNTSDWRGASGTAAGAHLERWCVNASTTAPNYGTLYLDGLYTYSSGAADPGTSCPSTVSGWTHSVIATKVVNSATVPLFTYDSTTLTAIRSVGIDLAASSKYGNQSTQTLHLQTGVTIRSLANNAVNAGTLPAPTCAADHTGILKLGTTTDANGNPYTAVFSEGGIIIGKGTSVAFATGSHTISVVVTDILGQSQTLSTTVTC